MTEQEKDLLLQDLCGRLLNKVMIYLHTSSEFTGSTIVLTPSIYMFIEDVLNNSSYEIKEIKPYLRPMSSMTEEEYNEYKSFECDTTYGGGKLISNGEGDDWLNAHHFDYRGLIEKGLALEAPEGMYN